MKKVSVSFTILFLLLGLCACTAAQPEDHNQGTEAPQGSTWQEQYDLGVRYLSEGNYEEAIIAFTAAIEIDPKRALAYVGRGDAYVKSGETEENLAAAKADYEKAVELDETNAEAYLGLADVYIWQEDYESAIEILKQGLAMTNDETLQTMLDSIFVEHSDANGFNPYGGVAFTRRTGYIPFLKLASAEKEVMIKTINAVIQGEQKTLVSVATVIAAIIEAHRTDIYRDVYEMDLYTVWNGYKIGLTSGYHTGNYLVNEDAYTEYCYQIEVRPQNDIGYYAEVTDRRLTDVSKISDDSYEIYYQGVNLITCPCVDWQWDGTLNGTENVEWLQNFGDNWVEKSKINYQTNGKMACSMREGEFTIRRELIVEHISPNMGEESSSQSWTEQYSGGICVKADPQAPQVKWEGDFCDLGASALTGGSADYWAKWLCW